MNFIVNFMENTEVETFLKSATLERMCSCTVFIETRCTERKCHALQVEHNYLFKILKAEWQVFSFLSRLMRDVCLCANLL